MRSCPTCSGEFETRRGVAVHHTTIHDEQLPNRQCKECGRDFHCEYDKKYCSEECHSIGVTFAGEANPNYQNKKSVADCELCGEQFEYYPSNKKGLYCSACVEQEQWRSLPNIDGTHNPQWGGDKVTTTCIVCGDSVDRYPSNVTSDITVCNTVCRAKWLSDAFSGSNHPNWKDGGNEAYGSGWNEVRKKALERDGYQCVFCSKSKDTLGRNPDVHHIIPVRTFIKSYNLTKEDAHHLENVVSLCVSCHRKAEFGKISPQELRSRIDVYQK
jgi:hypothetical protein